MWNLNRNLAPLAMILLAPSGMAASDRPQPVKFSLLSAKLEADPIPKAQILKGNPQAKSYLLHEDGGRMSGVWQCTPGRFRWEFPGDEVVHFLEGEAKIEWDNGASITVKKGEIAFLPRGQAIWTVLRTVRKTFTSGL